MQFRYRKAKRALRSYAETQKFQYPPSLAATVSLSMTKRGSASPSSLRFFRWPLSAALSTYLNQQMLSSFRRLRPIRRWVQSEDISLNLMYPDSIVLWSWLVLLSINFNLFSPGQRPAFTGNPWSPLKKDTFFRSLHCLIRRRLKSGCRKIEDYWNFLLPNTAWKTINPYNAESMANLFHNFCG